MFPIIPDIQFNNKDMRTNSSKFLNAIPEVLRGKLSKVNVVNFKQQQKQSY